MAVTHERLAEQCDLTLYIDPASAETGYRVRAAYAGLLRISSYGPWAQSGLASALRTATDLLDKVGDPADLPALDLCLPAQEQSSGH